MDRRVQLVIDRYNNKKREIETRTPQRSLVSPILFLIYISKVFIKVIENRSLVIFVSFIDDLGFIVSGSSVKEIVKALEKVAKEIIKWGRLNAVTYNTSKTEALLFSKSYWQWLNKQLQDVKIQVDIKSIPLNKEATWWLGVWLDNQFKFISYINEKVKRARNIEIQIKRLTKIY